MVLLVAAVRSLRKAGEPGTACTAESAKSRAAGTVTAARLTGTIESRMTELVVKLLLFRII